MRVETVASIFNSEPVQWGLRGDPFLWQLLKERYQTVELPYPPQVLREEILRIFADLTGELPVPGKLIIVVQFSFLFIQMVVNSMGVMKSAAVGVAEKVCVFLMVVALR